MRWLLVLLLALPAIARADNPALAEAKQAVDEIRYDDARQLLVQALKQGGNSPEELVEIYQLSGATAAVLGSAELAEQYYRRMLALAPDATLPPDASPRLREPFVAAQAYMAARQRFAGRAARGARGIVVTIVDPLGMVAAVATVVAGEVRGKQHYAGQPVVLEDTGGTVVLLDDSGNFLRVIELPMKSAVVAQPAVVAQRVQASTPISRRWITWAIPAGVLTGASAFLLIDAQRARARLDDILANSSQHYFDDAEEERWRWRGYLISGWVSAGLAVGFTATAIVMARSQPAAVRLTPSVGSDRATVQLEAKF